MQLISHQGILDPLDVEICRLPDGTDWLLGVGGHAKVQTALPCLSELLSARIKHKTEPTML